MPLSAPPSSIWWTVDQWAPGVYPEFVRRVFSGITPRSVASSWWRSTDDNHRVGGEPDSQHLIALGLDIQDPDLDALASRMRSAGLIAVRSDKHVHVQMWPAGTARSVGLLAALGL